MASSGAAAGEHSCVWALLCAANHSCAPNAHVVFAAGSSLATVRASRPIAAGEEVTVAYNEDAVWRPLRQRRQLLDGWGFHCRCARCVAEEGLPPGVRQEIEAIAAGVGDPSSPGPWRLLFRCAVLTPVPDADGTAVCLSALCLARPSAQPPKPGTAF